MYYYEVLITQEYTARESTDNPGPTRVELTDVGGRPVLTYTMMNGQTPAVLNVSRLPAGAYIVRCTAYEKTGMRRVMIGQ